MCVERSRRNKIIIKNKKIKKKILVFSPHKLAKIYINPEKCMYVCVCVIVERGRKASQFVSVNHNWGYTISKYWFY